MGVFRPSRERHGSDPRLNWKIALLLAGAVLGLAGMYFDDARLIGLGIVTLAAGILLRFLPYRG